MGCSIRRARNVSAIIALAIFSAVLSSGLSQTHKIARTQFENAERMREALNGLPADQRSQRDYLRVIDAYRKVYFASPSSSKADTSIMAVADLLTEMGRRFEDDKRLKQAIKQYEFLRHDYPGSKLRFNALFTIGQVYKDDLDDKAAAQAAFQSFLKHYPHNPLVPKVRQAISGFNSEARRSKNKREGRDSDAGLLESHGTAEEKTFPAKVSSSRSGKLPLMTNVRHWSTPDYTRVAIDLENEVKYEAGRVPSPDRIFFDFHDTKLASELAGKSFEVEDGFLHKIRLAQYTAGIVRVVLDVDEVMEYSAFFLPNPYRLIIDIRGKQSPKRDIAATSVPSADDSAVSNQNSADGKNISESNDRVTNQASSQPNPKRHPETGRLSASIPAISSADRHAKNGDRTPEANLSTYGNLSAANRSSERPPLSASNEPVVKATSEPTSSPTFESVSPRKGKLKRKKNEIAEVHTAQPTSSGERSLIRALGLKISKIVVDPGHGGYDTGTIGPHGLQEKDLVLDVGLRLGKLLEDKMGADVVYTRDDDTFVPLESRTGIANKEQADLFISVHANSSDDPGARGVETYYLNFTSSKDALEVAARENAVSETSIHELQSLVKKIALKDKIDESREFAGDVQKALYAGLSARRSGIRDRGVKKAPFVVLIGANMPSILAEISFVSNPSDESRLQTVQYRQRIAESLYRGIAKYISGLSGVKVASKNQEPRGQ